MIQHNSFPVCHRRQKTDQRTLTRDGQSMASRLAALVVICGMLIIGIRSSQAQETTETSTDHSFARLAEARIAEAVKLTDEQRAKVAELMTASAEEISGQSAAAG